jgi:hypothetical protein
MTRRVCSSCGHTLIQPRADIGGVMGAHMDAHTTMHAQRGEACWWIVTATPEPRPLGRQLAGLLVAIAGRRPRVRRGSRPGRSRARVLRVKPGITWGSG